MSDTTTPPHHHHKEKEKKVEFDPEEILRRKFRAKCRFRALARMVMANTYWLSEAVEEYEGLDNVKRRVEQAMRAKSKQKQLLNINDKALLNKPAIDRTDQEKKYIYRIIGGLKCFKRYPDNVKRKLAAVTYFKYYGPGRPIVRQNQEAHAMYFVVTGDVIVSALIYDELLQKNVSIELGQMHTGDMFGEVSLLHNIKRTATCTTSGHCEFLALMKEDFKNVLQASLQKQWDDIRMAMSSFTYFDNYDEVALREGCIVAKIKSFSCNDTIMGDGFGIPNYVYFVLSGRCQMIETLQVNVIKDKLGKQSYTLHDPYVRKSEGEIDFDAKYFSNITQQDTQPQPSIINESKKLSTEKPSNSLHTKSKQELTTSRLRFDKSPRHSEDAGKKGSGYFTPTKSLSKLTNLGTSTQEQQHGEQRQSKLLLHPMSQEPRESVQYELLPDLPQPNRRTYFMQVCQFLPGATFGFGENMRDRRIVAQTNVTCMLMPYIWLMQRNTVNIWSRIQHYLTKKIPTKDKLFKEFVKQRRWEEYREKTLQSVVGKTNRVNPTTISDVPYSIRIQELHDL